MCIRIACLNSLTVKRLSGWLMILPAPERPASSWAPTCGRLSARASGPSSPLGEEWALAGEIPERRGTSLGERLQVERQLDPAALGPPVPRCLLQPLIENDDHHGVARAFEPGPLIVRAELPQNSALLLEIDLNPLGRSGPSPGVLRALDSPT